MVSLQLILSQTLGDINGLSEELQNLIAAGEVDMEILGKAVLMQKILGASGLSPEDLGKAILLQQGMLEAGATPEGIAACLQKALNVSLQCQFSFENEFLCKKSKSRTKSGKNQDMWVKYVLHILISRISGIGYHFG